MKSRIRRLRIFYLLLAAVITLSLWYILRVPSAKHSHTFKLKPENWTYFYPMELLPKNDYTRLINITNFTFQILEDTCANVSPLVLILIHTSPENFRRRQIIRATWGQHMDDIKVMFVLGSVARLKLQSKIERENKKYKDFVQGNFIDSYRNLTYKHVMLFKYVIYHCPKAKYILKTDDDVFVNTYALLDFLKKCFSVHGATDLLFCKRRVGASVMRRNGQKWRVSVKEYPDRTYPPHCPGFIILYSPDVVFALYNAAQKTDYFWIDDVHVTGTLAQKTNISQTDASRYMIYDAELRRLMHTSNRRVFDILFGTFKLEEDILEWWKQLNAVQ